MKEFWVYKKDGSTYIEYANDEGEIYERMSNISYIESLNEDDNYNNKNIITDEILEMHYSKYMYEMELDDNLEEKNDEVQALNELVSIANNSNIVSSWDKNFIFGAFRSKNNLSQKQKYQIIKLQNKYSA